MTIIITHRKQTNERLILDLWVGSWPNRKLTELTSGQILSESMASSTKNPTRTTRRAHFRKPCSPMGTLTTNRGVATTPKGHSLRFTKGVLQMAAVLMRPKSNIILIPSETKKFYSRMKWLHLIAKALSRHMTSPRRKNHLQSPSPNQCLYPREFQKLP